MTIEEYETILNRNEFDFYDYVDIDYFDEDDQPIDVHISSDIPKEVYSAY